MTRIPLCVNCERFMVKCYDDHNPLGKYTIWLCVKCGMQYRLYDKPTPGSNKELSISEFSHITVPDGLKLNGEPFCKETSDAK